jgi:hypothetical protein
MEKFKILADKLGISTEELEKLEKGELEVDALAKQYAERTEANYKTRLQAELEGTIKSAAFGEAFGLTEKRVSEVFGIDATKYETVEKNKRLATMLEDTKANYEAKLSELSGADEKKTKQVLDQLELANTKIKELEKALKEEVEKIHSEYSAKEAKRIFENQITELVAGIEKAAFPPKIMKATFATEFAASGFGYEVDAEGRIWLTKNNTRVQNPARPTENLQLKDYFAQVSAENEFVAKSNGSGYQYGGGGQGGNGGGENGVKIHPNALVFKQKLQNKK